MKLKELEKRLEREPENLGLRVTVAGLMRQAGRSVEAVELYRSVAVAYRDQGRTQQAIAVCRSILEIAPDDAPCHGLLALLQQQPSRSSLDDTPLPRPVPHHVLDPTSRPYKISERELDMPAAEAQGVPSVEMDLAAEVETRQRPRIPSEQLRILERDSDPDLVTARRAALTPVPRDGDEEQTQPEPRDRMLFEDDDRQS